MIPEVKVEAKNLDVRLVVEDIQKDLAEQIPVEARRIMDESTPRGRIYLRGRKTGRFTKRGERAGLKRKAGTKTRQFTATKFHRASARGQAPAKDSGETYKSIRTRKTGRDSYKVVFGGAAQYLEFTLDRPFIKPAIDAAVKKVFG